MCLFFINVPDHGFNYPGSVSQQRDGFIHQRMGLYEVQHLVRERGRGAESGALASTTARSTQTHTRKYIRTFEIRFKRKLLAVEFTGR